MEKLFILLLLVSLSTGCAWENEETLYPESSLCDTLDVSYSEDVVPVLSNNCYECHSNANAPDFSYGHAFEDYEDVVNDQEQHGERLLNIVGSRYMGAGGSTNAWGG